MALYEALRHQHTIFIDKSMPAGTDWGSRIDEELSQADFLITLLSASAVRSEMVTGEIARAQQMAATNGGFPRILPVRLAYNEPFDYPLSAYLNRINWAVWNGPQDTPRLIDELNRAIMGQDLPVIPADFKPTHQTYYGYRSGGEYSCAYSFGPTSAAGSTRRHDASRVRVLSGA